MVDVAFVSSNPGKAKEVRALLRPYGVRVRWRRRLLPEPQADSLDDVVQAKLDAVGSIPGFVLVEDSGLFIESLNGFPGVYSAHVLKQWHFGPILELLESRSRGAAFRTVAGLRKGRRRWSFMGETRGTIARAPRGDGGFGYDPLFIPEGLRRTYAELSEAEKNATSHRARAMMALGSFLSAPGLVPGRSPKKS